MLLVGPQVPLHTFSYAFAGLLSKDKTWQIKFKYATSCSGMHNVIELCLFVVNFCLPVLLCIVTCFVCLFCYVLYLFAIGITSSATLFLFCFRRLTGSLQFYI